MYSGRRRRIMLTEQQKSFLEDNLDHLTCELPVAKIHNGDIYIRTSLGTILVCSPLGNIREEKRWPIRGVSMKDAQRSDEVIAQVFHDASNALAKKIKSST
jgi:hypothetical protein